MKIPHPDSNVPEYDAPPPAPYRPGKAGLRLTQVAPIIRPARTGVDDPSEKPRSGPAPEYHAPPPASSRKK